MKLGEKNISRSYGGDCKLRLGRYMSSEIYPVATLFLDMVNYCLR